MSSPLIVVDVQNGFLNDFTQHIPERIAHLIERNDFDPVLFTLFVNTPDSPYHAFLDWHACEAPPDTDLAKPLVRFADQDRVFTKPGLAGMPDELAERLRQMNAREVTLVGIDTDMCVLKVAMDAFDMGLKPVVLADCCASTAGLQAHFAGLAILSRNIGAGQLRDAGLNEGALAAPMVNGRH
jgi:nicotinamidase-related amidase